MPSRDWNRVGRRVRRLRRQRGLSQREVSGSRITPAHLSLIESGRRRPSPEVLRYLAERLGATEDQLLTGRDPGLETNLRLETERARYEIYQGRPAEMLPVIDGIIDHARKTDLSAAEAAALEVRGLALQKLKHYAEAIEAFDEAADLLEDAPIESRQAATTGRARCLFLMGDPRYAIHELETYLIELNRRPAVDPSVLAHVYAALIGPYFEVGLIDKAREAGDEVRRLEIRVSDPEVIGCMHMNLSGLHLSEGRIEDGLRSLTRAEDCFTQIGWKREIATAQIAQGAAHIQNEQWDDARKQLKAALSTLHDLADTTDRARALNQLGRVERLTGNPESAQKYLREALELTLKGNAIERGLAQRELALCASELGDPAGARDLLLQAIESYRAASNPVQVGLTFLTLGDIERQLGDSQRSVAIYREGLEATTAAAIY